MFPVCDLREFLPFIMSTQDHSCQEFRWTHMQLNFNLIWKSDLLKQFSKDELW